MDIILEEYRRRQIAAWMRPPTIAGDYAQYVLDQQELRSNGYREDYKPVFLIAPDLQALRQPASVYTKMQSIPDTHLSIPDSSL